MFLLKILAALALRRFWQHAVPVHKQPWFQRWARFFDRWPALSRHVYAHGLLVIVVPALAVALVVGWAHGVIAFMLAALVLLLCLAQDGYGDELQPYDSACTEGDWDRAVRTAERQGVNPAAMARDAWAELHAKMLEAVAYSGFERLFAVVFWFVLLGPLGAIVYRLSHAFCQTHPSEIARQWLWALEWLPARVLAASFALTGNFVGCANRLRQQWLSTDATAGGLLASTALGALSLDDEFVHSCDVTLREVAAIKRLYRRTLWLWLALLALWVLFGPARLF